MPKFAANLHYLFAEVPFLDRFEAAASAGFKGVEFQGPYDFPKDELRKRLDTHGLAMVLFDAPTGNWNAGDRGMTCIPGREAEFRASLERVVEYGDALGCGTVHVMAGVVGPDMDYETCRRTYIAILRHAAQFLQPHGIHVVIEPINKCLGIVANGPSYTTQGMHGYFLNHTADARAAIDAVAHPNLSLHLDCHHMQMLEGNLAETLRENIGRVRHIQLAGVPGRHEPDVGEINYPFLFDLLDELGYEGWVGCEYRPKGKTLDGLGWAARYGIRSQG